MKNLNSFAWRKEMPEELRIPILKALSHYPELQAKNITFKYTRRAGTSIMKAQPEVKSMLRLGEDRAYIVYMNRTLQLGQLHTALSDLPENILVGWIGHELGHVTDYESRTNWEMLIFAFGYLFSSGYIKKAENRADEYAIEHGLGKYIIQTKEFILNNADISEKYKKKIRKLYPSPEKIMELVNERETLNTVLN